MKLTKVIIIGLIVVMTVGLSGCLTIHLPETEEPAASSAESTPEPTIPEPESTPEPTPIEVPPSQESPQATLIEDSFVLASYDEERAQEAGFQSQTAVNYLVSHSILPINKHGFYVSESFYLAETDYIQVSISSDCPASLGQYPCPEIQDALIIASLRSPIGKMDVFEINLGSCEARRVGSAWESRFVCYSGHSGMFNLYITHHAATGFPEEPTCSHQCEYAISLCEQPKPMPVP